MSEQTEQQLPDQAPAPAASQEPAEPTQSTEPAPQVPSGGSHETRHSGWREPEAPGPEAPGPEAPEPASQEVGSAPIQAPQAGGPGNGQEEVASGRLGETESLIEEAIDGANSVDQIGEADETRDVGEADRAGDTDDTNEAHEVDEADETDETDEAEEAASAGRLRQRLLEQFMAWVDRMLVEEPPPDGVPIGLLADALEEAAGRQGPPDPAADVYSLYAALTGLTGEVRLQGRAFKQLADALSPLSELGGRLDQLEAAQLAAADELGEVANLARAQAEKASQAGDGGLPKAEEVLTVLFDLYDRLERAERTLEAMDAAPPRRSAPPAPPGWFDRLLGRRAPERSAEEEPEEDADEARDEALQAVREGYRLTLARLEGAFHQWGIERIGREGDMFDPARMAVVEVQPADGEADGTVLEVYRSGYAIHGRVITTAHVKVAKGQAGD